jgi:hypothetical protein
MYVFDAAAAFAGIKKRFCRSAFTATDATSVTFVAMPF